MAINASKSVFRRDIKEKLLLLSLEEREKQSEIVTQKLINLNEFKQSQRISIFLSREPEISTEKILKFSFNNNKQCFIPRCNGKLMDMVRLYSMEDFYNLPLNKWCIKEPLLDELRENALQTGGLDLVLVPGLAFTIKGNRLGYGGGFYDRFFKNKLLIINYYKEQIFNSLPIDEHDYTLDLILYP